MKYIHNISGKIEHLDYEIDINLNGKNLILVGGNGVGKTSILNSIYEAINIELEKNNSQIASFKSSLDYHKRNINNYLEGSNEYIDQLSSIKYYEEKIRSKNSYFKHANFPMSFRYSILFNIYELVRCLEDGNLDNFKTLTLR